jgi:ribonucrease Y
MPLLFEILTVILFATTGWFYYLFIKAKTAQPLGLTKEDFDIALAQSKREIHDEKSRQLLDEKQELRTRFDEKLASAREETQAKNELIVEKLKLQAKNDLQEEERAMRKRLIELQENMDKKESLLEAKLEKLSEDRVGIEKYKDDLRNIKDDLLNKKKLFEDQQLSFEEQKAQELGRIARLLPEEARTIVMEQAKESMGGELLNWQQKYLESAREEADVQAREVVALAVQRCSSEVANELTITTVKLQHDEDKGKLIGKEGRNIKWIEKTLGVELVIDETPGMVTLSGFSSVRRNIAKKTLERLLADGRVHPASIEDQYAKAKNEIAQEIADAGQEYMTFSLN